MRDRENNKYGVHTLTVDGREISIGVLSRARQFKKASGRTGRQWSKYRKAQRHIAKYEQDTRNGRVW